MRQMAVFDTSKSDASHFIFKFKFSTEYQLNCSRVVSVKRSNICLPKQERFYSFHVSLKKQADKNIPDNLFPNIKLFHVLGEFPFTTKEIELNFYRQKLNARVSSWVAKQLKA